MENSSKPQLVYSNEMPKNHQDIILKGFHAQAESKKHLRAILPFSFSYIDEDSVFIAGISGTTLYGGMHIDSLYVEDNHRKKGLGKALIASAEKLAKERGYAFCYLGTMDFEAKPFYESLGYIVEHVREGYHNASVMYLMRKEL